MSSDNQARIRNFCIIAHIDHGKSTLADRLIQQSGLLTQREMQAQVLDNMDLERERGITIKAQAVRLVYRAGDGVEYILNLIDTPGHVDFNYEVSRSLAACEGAVLVVDAAQGVEAQTLANVYLALDANLEIVPVINKIDLPSADAPRVINEIEDIIGIPAEDAPLISAKANINIDAVFEKVVQEIPHPTGDIHKPLKALIFDSIYDPYRGVIVFIRVFDGKIRKGSKVLFMATQKEFEVVEAGYFGPGQFIPCDELSAGEVGYFTASIKNLTDTQIGDTVTELSNPASEPLPGYKKVNPMVYCGIFPADGSRYQDLRDALDKLKLNDASLMFEAETSTALGFGFRCGFLGLLHLEIIQERLEREYNLDLVTTAPSVIYKIYKTDESCSAISNPADFPDPVYITKMEEPIVKAEIILPKEYIGTIMELCQERRGEYIGIEYIEETRARLTYELPLNEIIYDFFDVLKSRSRGYASFDYELTGYTESDLVKLDILVNRELVDALSFIVHRSTSYERGRKIVEKLKKEIPRHLFEIPIQASIGNKIIARETVSAVQAVGKAEGRQKAYAYDRQRRASTVGVYERTQAGRRVARMKKDLSLYIHIPFCKSKCAYCDFLSFAETEEALHKQYMDVLAFEIAAFASEYRDYTISTLFIGGGTPSLLAPRYIASILKVVYDNYNVSKLMEITIEANPETVDKEKLESYLSCGINRISFGVQSLDDRLLKTVSRIHTKNKFIESYLLARQAGFQNINIDLMYGLPNQSLQDFQRTAEQAVILTPEHISCYGLILEEGTRLYDQISLGNAGLALPDEEQERAMYEFAKCYFEQYGYRQYEISNYAKPGFESRHNLTYWSNGAYVGFGLGAHSYIDGKRFHRTSRMQEYLNKDFEHQDIEVLTQSDRYAEYMFLGLRKMSGISISDFHKEFGVSLYDFFGDVIKKHIRDGLLKEDHDRICLTEQGVYVSNRVMADFLL
ncbi:translation factor guf1-related [Holotrichia oblita]|nr:translation factor guf1-related [Holotrichia oblita]